ncbi:MAG: hypothetical protein ABSD57_03075 [Verrucomicrobiota bacterium]|jgi:hypothetical protein
MAKKVAAKESLAAPRQKSSALVDKTARKTEITKIPVEMFWLMLASYCEGMERLARARAGFFETIRAYHASELDTVIENHDMEAFKYVHQISHLVHANSLFDTFLSDCTRLLLSMHPGAIGVNQQVSLQTILQAGTRADILNQAISKKTRELGMQSTVTRLEFLRETFGVVWEVDGETRKTLERYANKRNLIVHDQGVFEIAVDNNGDILCSSKTCRHQPTPVSNEEVVEAYCAFSKTVSKFASSMFSGVFKVKLTDKMQGLLNSLETTNKHFKN